MRITNKRKRVLRDVVGENFLPEAPGVFRSDGALRPLVSALTNTEVIDSILSVPEHFGVQTRFEVGTVGVSKNWSSTATWSSSSNGSTGSSVPIITNNVTFDGFSGDCVVDVNPGLCANLVFSLYPGALTGINPITFTGVFATSSVTNLSGYSGAFTFIGTIVQSWTANGGSLKNMTVNGVGGLSQTDAAIITDTLTLTAGSYSTNTKTASCGNVVSSNSSVRTLDLTSSTLTLTGTGTVFDVSTATNLTLTTTSSVIIISDTSSSKTFAGGGQAYATIQTATGIGALTITGSNSFSGFNPKCPLVLTSTTQTLAGSPSLDSGCTAITGGSFSLGSGQIITAAPGTVITNNTIVGGGSGVADGCTLVGTTTGWSKSFTSQHGGCSKMGHSTGLGVGV